jgi:hypothetical protein
MKNNKMRMVFAKHALYFEIYIYLLFEYFNKIISKNFPFFSNIKFIKDSWI